MERLGVLGVNAEVAKKQAGVGGETDSGQVSNCSRRGPWLREVGDCEKEEQHTAHQVARSPKELRGFVFCLFAFVCEDREAMFWK